MSKQTGRGGGIARSAEISIVTLAVPGGPDLQATLAFLDATQHEDVLHRDRADTLGRVIPSLSLAVVQADRIVGCSLAYRFQLGRECHVEIGSMRIILGSFGLQAMMMRLQLYLLSQTMAGRASAFAVVRRNTASEHNLMRKVGMEPWTMPDGIVAQRCAAGLPPPGNKNVLRATEITFGLSEDFLSRHWISAGETLVWDSDIVAALRLHVEPTDLIAPRPDGPTN